MIPKALFTKYAHLLNSFDENTTVELEDHSGSHPGYSDAVTQALNYCVTMKIDCGLFASALASHLCGLNSVKDIDFIYLRNNVILPLTPAPPSYQSSSGTIHTRRTPFDPSSPPPPPKSRIGRLLKPRKSD